ncbi:MAG TPA: hypothetical protein VFQ72_00155 [Candidatus Paceibacterota bacterium]|nr:hypothetical protein [Candidatus Paceibacterota bacterium]
MNILTSQGLHARLVAHDIDTEGWGIGSHRSFDDLLAELASGEASLIDQEGRLVYWSRRTEVRVIGAFGDEIHVLARPIKGRVAKGDAGPAEAAERSVRQALQIPSGAEVALFQDRLREPPADGPSRDYPGLWSAGEHHLFLCFISRALFESLRPHHAWEAISVSAAG